MKGEKNTVLPWQALLLLGSLPVVTIGQPLQQVASQNDKAVLAAYYPPAMQATLPAGANPFVQMSPLAGVIPGVAYSASMSPGDYPYYTPIFPASAWGPSVNAWLTGRPYSSAGAASGSEAPPFVIAPPSSFAQGTAAPSLASGAVDIPAISDGSYVTEDGDIVAPPELTQQDVNSNVVENPPVVPGSPLPQLALGDAQPQLALGDAQLPTDNAPSSSDVNQQTEIVNSTPVVADDLSLPVAASSPADPNSVLQVGASLPTDPISNLPVTDSLPASDPSLLPTDSSSVQAPSLASGATEVLSPPSGPVLAAAATTTVAKAKYPIKLGVPTTRLWNGKDLRAMKINYSYGNGTAENKAAVDGIIARANVEAGKRNFYSVTLQTLLRVNGSTKNDYVSIGPYMWPCDSYPTTCQPRWSGGTPGKCDTKLHMPWISCDVTGEKNPSVASAGLGDVQFSNYWTAMTDLSLAYYYTESTKYATRAADLTRKFFLAAATKMAPNMKYGQLWPGARTGSPSGIVEILKLVEIIDCIEILKLSPTIWKAADNNAMVTWARQMLAWYNKDPLGVQARDAKNNIALWWHHTMLSVALYVGDAATANTITSRMSTTVIPGQIAANGNLPQEVIRPTSRQYTAYALTAITRTATMSQVTRTRLWTNARVKAAVTMFSKYANGNVAWPYADTQTTYDWKFWGEWLKSAALALRNRSYEQSYLATKAASVRAFGVPPAAVCRAL